MYGFQPAKAGYDRQFQLTSNSRSNDLKSSNPDQIACAAAKAHVVVLASRFSYEGESPLISSCWSHSRAFPAWDATGSCITPTTHALCIMKNTVEESGDGHVVSWKNKDKKNSKNKNKKSLRIISSMLCEWCTWAMHRQQTKYKFSNVSMSRIYDPKTHHFITLSHNPPKSTQQTQLRASIGSPSRTYPEARAANLLPTMLRHGQMLFQPNTANPSKTHKLADVAISHTTNAQSRKNILLCTCIYTTTQHASRSRQKQTSDDAYQHQCASVPHKKLLLRQIMCYTYANMHHES